MKDRHTETETWQVSSFDQVAIRGNTCSAQVLITQGEQEELTIEAPLEYLHRMRGEVKEGKLTVRLQGSWLQELEDALATCINRPPILYHLKVRKLTQLEVQCAYLVHASRIETPHLHIRLNGTGDFKLDWLTAETLEIYHGGAGTMRISGQVENQKVMLNGAGSYIAPGLDSQHASVRITGMSLARVHVNDALEVTLRGMGSLEYSGRADVRKRVSGLGRVVHIEKASEEAA